jgi:hypothetical protein
VFISRAQIASSSGGMPMNDPMTRETDRLGDVETEVGRSRALEPSRTRVVIARISSSCSAMRFGVNPRWKSALSGRAWAGPSR